MSFAAIVALAIGLAMDAAAVSVARGLATPKILPRHMILVAVFFGGSQALMPVIGWLLGSRIGPAFEAWDHWIAFGLLSAIGGKMLWEAREERSEPADDAPDADLFGLAAMLALAVATSIDALAVGFTLPMLGAPFALSIATIGITTALLSVLGLFAGRRFGALLGPRLDALGGLVLIGLGAKIVIEHLGGS